MEIKVTIPNKLHTHLIGAKGRTIQGIIQECGNVQVQMPSPGSTSDEITIRGPQADAEKARDLLQKIATDRVSERWFWAIEFCYISVRLIDWFVDWSAKRKCDKAYFPLIDSFSDFPLDWR